MSGIKFEFYFTEWRYKAVFSRVAVLVFMSEIKFEFYFTEWTPKAVFSRVAVATSENTNFSVHEWYKIRSYTEKIKFSVSFMLLFTTIKLLPAFRLSRQKTNFFSSNSASVWSCSACFGWYTNGWKRSFAHRIWAQIAFKATKRKKSAQKKKCRSQWQPAWRSVQKKRYVSTISDVSGSITER